jgi:DNA-binding GntR family transcriptional regulator
MASPSTLSPFPGRGEPITSAVHARLRDAILTLELAPGRKISQLELTRQLGVSRTPLREALRLLEREGLIAPSTPHGLVVIAPLSLDDLEDLYSLRVAGESLAMWLTVPILDADAVKVLAAELRAIERGDPELVRPAHRRFHAGLRAGAGQRMQRELGQLFEHAERYQRALVTERKRRTRPQKEHRAILRACKEGDRALATQLLMQHCAATVYELISVMAPGRPTPSLDAAVAMVDGTLTS